MNGKSKNVFEKEIEALENLLEELQTTNSLLFAIGSELFDVGEKLDSLLVKVEAFTVAPVKIDVDYDKLADAIVMAIGFTVVPEEKAAAVVFKEAAERGA